jgi:hypothetical protein
MNVLIQAIRTCHGIVRDIEVQGLENELEKLKEANQSESNRELGYGIEEDPPE